MNAITPHPGVLHLVSAPSSTNDQRPQIGRLIPAYLCAQAIKQGLTPPGQVVLVGDPQSERHAHSIGLKPSLRYAPPMGRVQMLARTIRSLSRNSSRIICWNDELAPLLRGLHAPADLISTRPELMTHRVSSKVDIRVFERPDRDVWESRNHSAELDTVLAPLISDPPPLPLRIDRATMGIAPDDICIGVIADRPSDIDARSIAFLIGLLNASGFPITCVMPEGASHIAAAKRHHRGLEEQFRLLFAREPMITMLPLFDILIHPCYDGSGSAMLIERLCENADTPVLRLRSSDRSGLSRAPAVAGPIIEALDEIFAHRKDPALQQTTEAMIHA